MTPPRFQFTIRGLLRATFWVALWGSCYLLISRTSDRDDWWWNIIGMILWASPFAAVGALFGRTFWGLVAGLGVVAVLGIYYIAQLMGY